jgi:hypothetical protein
MAAKQLVELKDQIKELLEKCYICPSSPPMGSPYNFHPREGWYLSGTLPRVPRAAGYYQKSLIRWALHSSTWLGPTHPISRDGPTSKDYTYGPPT